MGADTPSLPLVLLMLFGANEDGAGRISQRRPSFGQHRGHVVSRRSPKVGAARAETHTLGPVFKVSAGGLVGVP